MKYEYSHDLPMIDLIAKTYYDEQTYNHAQRVANFIRYDTKIKMGYDNDFRDFCTALALCHDLFEDTNIPKDIFNEELTKGIEILTRKPKESYIKYCNRVNLRNKQYYNNIDLAAWYVKLADMKDHLTQTETLTDKLKAKYLEGMTYLL